MIEDNVKYITNTPSAHSLKLQIETDNVFEHGANEKDFS